MTSRLKQSLIDHKTPLLLGFMGLNFLLTGVDVALAHSQNHFFRWELIPLLYSPCAVVAILAQIFKPNPQVRRLFKVVMWLGIAVGVLGTFFHITGNATSSQQSLHSLLIMGSPIAAPIAFSGISLYALAAEQFSGQKRISRLMLLVGLGFGGAVLAAFLDHARLEFVPIYTLIPIVTGTLAALACFYLAFFGQTNPAETQLCLVFLGLNLVTGLLGFGFHVLGDLAGTQSLVFARFMYRNPILGPLLFSNLALLGGISLLPEKK